MKIQHSSLIINILLIFLLVVIGLSFYKYLVGKDYLIYAEVSCNTLTESCFIEDCEVDDPRCDPETNQHIYKIIEKDAAHIIPLESCSESSEYCEITYCTEEIIEEFELDASCTTL